MSNVFFDPNDFTGVTFIWISHHKHWLVSQDGETVVGKTYTDALFELRRRQCAKRGDTIVPA
jgi:hypothetical protein